MKWGLVVVAAAAVLLSSSVPALTVNPGFRTAFTSKGLDYVRQVTIPILEKSLSSLPIPDISGSADDVDYTLSSIQLNSLQIPTSSLTSGSKGLQIQASGISMKIHADWSYRLSFWPHTSDHGDCDVSVSSVSLTISMMVGKDSQGHATLAATGCSISISHIDIDFHGGASWLYNLFSDYIADKLKGSVQGQVCKQATDEINTAGNHALESLPVVIKVGDVAEINYALIQTPTYASTYVETQHKGEFFSISHPVEAPFTPPPLPPVTNTSKMMYIWLTDYIVDTAGFVFQEAGILKYNITPDMVPPTLPIQLDTSSFKLIIPQLYNKYPNMKMQLELNATTPPDLTIVPGLAELSVPGHVIVYVLPPNNTAQVAFVLGVVIHTSVSPFVDHKGTTELVKANVTFLKTELSLVSSNIGSFDITVLQDSVDLLSKLFIVPLLNHYGNVGLTIPVVDGMSLVNSAVVLGQGYAVVNTDFNYKPTGV